MATSGGTQHYSCKSMRCPPSQGSFLSRRLEWLCSDRTSLKKRKVVLFMEQLLRIISNYFKFVIFDKT